MYGYQDSTELSQPGGNFGLNTGVVTKFEYNPNAGADGTPQDAIDFTVKILEKDYMHRYFPVSKVYAKGGGELTDVTTDEYKANKKKDVAQLNASLTDIVGCFVSQENIKAALATPINNFKDFALVLQRLVQTTVGWNEMQVDVFLQYQWTPKGDYKISFTEIPKNVKHGTFVCKSQGPGFKAVTTETSLTYVKEDGTVHPFKRSAWFIKSAFAVQTKLAGSGDSEGDAMGGDAPSTGNPATANW